MPESDRPLSSLIIAALLILGGIVTFGAGAGYLNDPDVSVVVAMLDVIAGLMLIVGGVCCIVGRPALWKIVFASLVAEIVAGIGMFTIAIVGGIVLIAISTLFIMWIHSTAIRNWFKV